MNDEVIDGGAATPVSAAVALELVNVSASYDTAGASVLRNVTIRVEAGELIALLGASGCGKTTLLRVVAGLLAPTHGDVRIGGASVTHLPAERRRVALVFQKPLLFPFLSVGENVAFGLKMKGISKPERLREAADALALVRLEGFGSRRPRELSGGQEQRVALARALVTRPRLLLLDEPFSALDERLRLEMRRLVRKLQRQLGITTLFVTHDQREAASLADRIAFMHDGTLEQFAAPRQLYLAPATVRAARFFGWHVVEGTQRGELIETSIGCFVSSPSTTARNEATVDSGTAVSVAFNPAQVSLASDEETTNVVVAKLEAVGDFGTSVRYTLLLDDNQPLELERTPGSEWFDAHNAFSQLKPGMNVRLNLNAVRVYDERTPSVAHI